MKALPYVVQLILDYFPRLRAEDVKQRLQFSTFVSLPQRYMYCEVPKAGCSQMKELLRTLVKAPPVKLFAGGLRVTGRDMFLHARENVPLPSLIDLDDDTQQEVLKSRDFFRFTVVRNPYTRLVSAWKNKILLCEPEYEETYFLIKGHLPELHAKKSLVSFEEFVNYIAKNCDLGTCNIHWRRQTEHVFWPVLNFSCVGRLEQIGDFLRRFQRHLGLSQPLATDGKNVSAPVGAAIYTPVLADKVYALYEPDFQLLGYDRNSWPSGGAKTRTAAVPEEKFCHEIIERNLIIARLYQERERLEAQLQRESRLHLPEIDWSALRRLSLQNLQRLNLLKPLASFRRTSLRGWRKKAISSAVPAAVQKVSFVPSPPHSAGSGSALTGGPLKQR